MIIAFLRSSLLLDILYIFILFLFILLTQEKARGGYLCVDNFFLLEVYIINIHTGVSICREVVEAHLCFISFAGNGKSFERKAGCFRGYGGIFYGETVIG